MERTSSPGYQPEQQARRLSLDTIHHVGTPVATFDVEAGDKGDNGIYKGDGDGGVALQLGAPDNSEEGDVSQIEMIPEHKRVQIDINDVSAWVPSLFGQPSFTARANPMRLLRRGGEHSASAGPKFNQILFGVSGCIRPGEVTALMGPSGSGKTTLLSIIGGRTQRNMRVEGTVLFDGAPLTKDKKRRVGYVMQDDLLYEALTVQETLHYAAMLRLPRAMSHADKLARVASVISALGLDKCRETIIGGFFRRGISGGERKRVSVGHELLINPSVLLLDEPTSGLDSTTAMHLLETLRQLAQGGRTVATTIHQPSSRLYQKLDKLLLLSQGHAVYYGKAQHAVDYFEGLGFAIPPRVNAADFLLDLASGEVAGEGNEGEAARLHLISCAGAYLADHTQDGFDLERDAGALQELRESMANGGVANSTGAGGPPPAFRKSFRPLHTIQSAAALLQAGGKSIKGMLTQRKSGAEAKDGMGDGDEHRWGAPYLMQIRYLFQRSLRTRRFESLSPQDFIQYGVIAVLSGLFWLQTGQGDSLVDARNTLGLVFFILMFVSFRSLFVSLFTFPEEQRHMLKERASGMYRLSAFYIARTMSDLPMELFIPSIFLIIVYFMGGLKYSAGAFFGTYFTVVLCLFIAQGVGLLLGAWAMNPKTAQILCAGYFVVDLPAWIGWLKWLSFVFYALGLLVYLQFDGRTLYSCTSADANLGCAQTNPGGDLAVNPVCSPVVDLQQSLGLLQDPSSQVDAIRNGFILLGVMIALRVIVYFALRKKTSGL